MKEKLTALYNTLITIETKGANTEIMADCMKYLRALIAQTPDEVATEALATEDTTKEAPTTDKAAEQG